MGVRRDHEFEAENGVDVECCQCVCPMGHMSEEKEELQSKLD